MNILEKVALLPPGEQTMAMAELKSRFRDFACASIKDAINKTLAAKHIYATQIRYMCNNQTCSVGVTGDLNNMAVATLISMGASCGKEAATLKSVLMSINPAPTFVILSGWRAGCSSASILPHHVETIKQCEQAVTTGLSFLHSLCKQVACGEYMRMSLDVAFADFLEESGYDIDENGNILE